MLPKKIAASIVIALLMIIGIWTVYAGAAVEQKSVLAGRVASAGLIAVGEKVEEGSVLVNIETITGLQPAARATVAGVVKEVRVKPGDVIHSGDTVVCVEPLRK